MPRKRRKGPGHLAATDLRISSRGMKIPNYADDGGFRSDDFMEEDDNAGENGYTGAVQYGPDGQPIEPAADEIDGVFGHSRNEDFGMLPNFPKICCSA